MNPELAVRHLRNLRRAWSGATLCRQRLAEADESAPVIPLGYGFEIKDDRGHKAHDVDYYAWEAVRIMNIARKTVGAGLAGKDAVEQALAELRAEAPYLETFRHQVTHVEDNRGADDVVYFGQAVRLKPGGDVEYLVDPRYRQNDLLAALVDLTEAALRTLAATDD